MSKFVRVKTELRDVELIKRALDDLRLTYRERARYIHPWSKISEEVPLLVSSAGVTFGLRPRDDGVFEVLGDDMQMRPVQERLARIQQRYAYHKVLAETARAGFDLVEEKTDRGEVIRLTLRRWAQG